MTQMNYSAICKITGTDGQVMKLTTAEGMPSEDKKFFAQRFCDEFTYTWDAQSKKWKPYHLISYLPWHIRHLIELGEVQVAHDAAQTTVETLRRLEVKLSRKEDTCGQSFQDTKDLESSTPKPAEQSAPSSPTEISGEPSHGLF